MGKWYLFRVLLRCCTLRKEGLMHFRKVSTHVGLTWAETFRYLSKSFFSGPPHVSRQRNQIPKFFTAKVSDHSSSSCRYYYYYYHCHHHYHLHHHPPTGGKILFFCCFLYLFITVLLLSVFTNHSLERS